MISALKILSDWAITGIDFVPIARSDKKKNPVGIHQETSCLEISAKSGN